MSLEPEPKGERRSLLGPAAALCVLAGMFLLLRCGGALRLPGGLGQGWRPQLVILLALDTLRFDHVGCYGYDQAVSPHVDQLAHEGVLFENAFSQGNRTLVSFSSLLTGCYPPYYSKGPEDSSWHLAAEHPTLASVCAS